MAVQTPREVLVSLVDLNVIDASSLLNACLQEMSDAECKRVLNMLSLPSGSDPVEDEDTELPDDNSQKGEDDSAEQKALDDENSTEEPSPSEALQRRLVRLERLLRRLERNR